MSSISTYLGPMRLADLASDPDYLPCGPDVAGRPRQFRAVDMPAAEAAHTALYSALAARSHRVIERISYKTPGLPEVLTALVEALAQIETTAQGAFGPCGLSREAWIQNWIGDDPESYSTWQRLSAIARCAGAKL